jgi:hypothetical protein
MNPASPNPLPTLEDARLMVKRTLDVRHRNRIWVTVKARAPRSPTSQSILCYNTSDI